MPKRSKFVPAARRVAKIQPAKYHYRQKVIRDPKKYARREAGIKRDRYTRFKAASAIGGTWALARFTKRMLKLLSKIKFADKIGKRKKEAEMEFRKMLRMYTFQKPDFNLIEVEISARGKNELFAIKFMNQPLFMNWLSEVCTQLRWIWIHVMAEWRNQIQKVAKDTGVLRRALGWVIGSDVTIRPRNIPRYTDDVVLKMAFNAILPYMEYVNTRRDKRTGKYITLKHFGRPDSRRTGKPLYDPHAEEKIINYNRSTILKAFRAAIRPRLHSIIQFTADTFNISYATARRYFDIKHIRGII